MLLARKLRTAVSGGGVANTSDPNFNQTVLLLHGDGTNGGQNNTFLDNKSSSPGDPVDWYGTFDGSSQQLSLTNNAAFQFGTGDFTVEFYMYPTSWTIYQRVIALGGYASAGNFQVEVTNSGAVLYVHINGGLVGFNTSFSLNTWYHVAVVRSSGTVTVYVNGSSVGTSSQSGTVNSTSALYIGSEGGANYFAGRISNVRLVKGTAVYTTNFTPFKGSLTAVSGTSLLTLQSSTIVDNSPNAFSITNTGTVTMTQIPGTGPAVFTVTRNGNTTQGTFSPFSVANGNWSNYFDGTGDSLSAPFTSANFDFGTGDFTVEAWIYINKPFSGSGIWSIWSNLSGAPLSNNKLLFGFDVPNSRIGIFYDSTGYFTAANSISVNTWTHVALTRASNTARIFANGTQIGTVSLTTNFNAGVSCTIGENFPGYISNLRIVKGTAVYTSAFTPSTSPLTAITNTTLLTCQSNQFRDASVNNLAITRNGDVSVRPFSPFAPTAVYSANTNGGSGYFDGTGDYLTVADDAALRMESGNFTIEFWWYPSSISSYQTIFDKGYNSAGAITLQTGLGDGIVVVYSGGSALITASSAATVNAWNHYALVRSGTTLTLYRNGTSVGTATNSTNFNNTGTLNIGGSLGGGGYYVNGYMSNVRVVKGTAVYTANFTPPTAPLTSITNTSLLLNFTNAAIIDNTGKNVLETVGNAQISTSVKKFGTGSLAFDGTGDYLMIPNSIDNTLGSGNWTIEFWIYFSALPTFSFIYEQRSVDTQVAPCIYTNSSNISFFVNGADRITGTGLTTGTWYHFALAKSGSTTKMFLNGTQAGTDYTDTNDYVGNIIYVGTRRNIQEFLNGYIDDLRVTKGIARYTANFTPPTSAFLDK